MSRTEQVRSFTEALGRPDPQGRRAQRWKGDGPQLRGPQHLRREVCMGHHSTWLSGRTWSCLPEPLLQEGLHD